MSKLTTIVILIVILAAALYVTWSTRHGELVALLSPNPFFASLMGIHYACAGNEYCNTTSLTSISGYYVTPENQTITVAFCEPHSAKVRVQNPLAKSKVSVLVNGVLAGTILEDGAGPVGLMLALRKPNISSQEAYELRTFAIDVMYLNSDRFNQRTDAGKKAGKTAYVNINWRLSDGQLAALGEIRRLNESVGYCASGAAKSGRTNLSGDIDAARAALSDSIRHFEQCDAYPVENATRGNRTLLETRCREFIPKSLGEQALDNWMYIAGAVAVAWLLLVVRRWRKKKKAESEKTGQHSIWLGPQ